MDISQLSLYNISKNHPYPTNLDLSDPKTMQLFTYLPKDIQKEILSRFTHVEDIKHLSQSSLYLRNLLEQSIKYLTHEDELCFLDIEWLSNFPALEVVDDNIIFSLSLDDLIQIDLNELRTDRMIITIPRNLRKFNLCISFCQPSEKVKIVIQSILKQLLNNLNEYTVRFIINNVSTIEIPGRSTKYEESAIVIDQGRVIFFRNIYLNLLFTTTLNIDPFKIFNDIGIQIIKPDMSSFVDRNRPFLYLYYMSYNDYLITGELQRSQDMSQDMSISGSFLASEGHPKLAFKDFLNDLSLDMNINLLEMLTGYRSRGYLRDLCSLIFFYLNSMSLDPDEPDMVQLAKLKIANYLNIGTRALNSKAIIGQIRHQFFFPDKKYLIAHLYLDEPSIYQLIMDDNDKLTKEACRYCQSYQTIDVYNNRLQRSGIRCLACQKSY